MKRRQRQTATVQQQLSQESLWVVCADLVRPKPQLADHSVLGLGQPDTMLS